MRKLSIACFFIITSLACDAQVPPGGDFEDWRDYSGGFSSWSDPDGWTSPNFFSSLNGFASVSATNDAIVGDSAALLETFPLGLAGVPFIGYLVNGQAEVDSLDGSVNVMSGGEPVSEKYQFIRGWYKYSTIELFDSAQVEVIQKKWNGSSADTVAYLKLSLPPVPNWTFFQAEIPDLISSDNPDTAVIAIFSSRPDSPKEGGDLWVDGIELSNVLSSENDLRSEEDAVIFPNPSHRSIRLHLNAGFHYRIRDFGGRVVLAGNWTGDAIDILQLKAGVYVVEWESKGRIPGREKLLVR